MPSESETENQCEECEGEGAVGPEGKPCWECFGTGQKICLEDVNGELPHPIDG